MNPHDKENLKFLMSVSPEVLRDWYNTVSQEDVDYAMELLAYASDELDRTALVQAATECINRSLDDENLDCSAAKTLLSKFTLKGIK
jgi:hypothetical protein